MGNLEKLQGIDLALPGFESSSNILPLASDVDEGCGVFSSRDTGILEVGKHEVGFERGKEIHTFLQMPRISPPTLFHRGIPIRHGLSFCLGRSKMFQSSSLKRRILGRGTIVNFCHRVTGNFDQMADEMEVLAIFDYFGIEDLKKMTIWTICQKLEEGGVLIAKRSGSVKKVI